LASTASVARKALSGVHTTAAAKKRMRLKLKKEEIYRSVRSMAMVENCSETYNVLEI